jgi:hypothetical protein
MAICLIFVNVCMIEFIIVTFIASSGKEWVALKIECICRVAVPVTFVMCNLIYWSFVFI